MGRGAVGRERGRQEAAVAAAEVGVVRKEERAELSCALMKTHELQYFLDTSLRNTDLARKSS